MFQLNWSILKILSFEPLCDLLMTFYILHYISFIMLRMPHAYFYSSFSSIGAFWKFEFWTPLDPLMAFYYIAFCFIMLKMSRHFSFSPIEAFWKIWFSNPLWPLMIFYNITYILSCLECHSHTFSQVSAQLKHFEKCDFRTTLWPLNDSLLHSICLIMLKMSHAYF